MKHLITVDDLDYQFISDIINHAQEYKYRRYFKRQVDMWDILSQRLKNRLLITDFFEPSTRTRLSFEAAMTYLGGNVIGTENAAEFSSFKKGESIADNFRVISGYCDCIVGRFLHEGDAKIAADAALVPVINGGDGKGEHPTQALIDLFSITEKFPEAENLRITFVGDNKYSRTVQSLVQLLAKFPCVKKMNFVSPPSQQVGWDMLNELRERNTDPWLIEYRLTPELMAETDVIYVTRSQIERHDEALLDDPAWKPEDCILTEELANMMPDHGLILHPLPRNSELPPEVDSNPRAYYFQQAHNGLFVRMAILEALCQT